MIKSSWFLALTLCVLPMLLGFQKAPVGATHDLKITVTHLANSNGLVEFAIYKTPELFTKTGKTCRLERVTAKKGEVSTVIENLEAGKYAIVVYHDENHNKICDKNFLGIPTEAYAFSNNVRPNLSVPGFDECAINLQQDRQISIKMVY